MRASLTAVAVINFFDFVFMALFVLYLTGSLHVRPGLLGLVLGAGAVGGVIGSVLTRPIAARIGIGWAYVAGCVLFPAPLAGGALGTLIGVRPALWIAAIGGLTGFVWLLPSPIPGFRMPSGPGS